MSPPTSTTEMSKKRPSEDTNNGPQSKREKPERSGLIYDLNCKYNELLASKKPRQTRCLIEEILDKMIFDKSKCKMTPSQSGSNSDIARALQMCLKKGTKNQRLKILEYYLTAIPELLLSPAGGMLVEKILRYVPKIGDGDGEGKYSNENDENDNIDEKKLNRDKLKRPESLSHNDKKEQDRLIEKIIQPLLSAGEKQLSKIFFHKHGCKCLNKIYGSLFIKPRHKNSLLNLVLVPKQISLFNTKYNYDHSQNLRGPQGILRSTNNNPFFKSGTDENKVLEETLLPHIRELVDRCIDKELLDQPLTHQVLSLYGYLLAMNPTEENSNGGKEKADNKETATVEDSTTKENESSLDKKESVNSVNESESLEQLRTFVDQRLPIDACPHLLQTKPGVEALIRFLSVFSAKNKKTLIKAMKGRFFEMATNNVCYLLVCRLLQTIDDTVMSQKQILQELITPPDQSNKFEGNVHESKDDPVTKNKAKQTEKYVSLVTKETQGLNTLLNDSYGRKVLYSVLESPNGRFFDPYEMENCFNLSAPTALKDPKKRRDELAKFLVPKLSESLVKMITPSSVKLDDDEEGDSDAKTPLLDLLSTQKLKDFGLYLMTNESSYIKGEVRKQLVKQFMEEMKTKLVKAKTSESENGHNSLNLNNQLLTSSCTVLIRNSGKEFINELFSTLTDSTSVDVFNGKSESNNLLKTKLVSTCILQCYSESLESSEDANNVVISTVKSNLDKVIKKIIAEVEKDGGNCTCLKILVEKVEGKTSEGSTKNNSGGVAKDGVKKPISMKKTVNKK